jgi:hypothetical protein
MAACEERDRQDGNLRGVLIQLDYPF